MKSTFPRNLRFKEPTTEKQGHEETRQHSEASVSEEEEASAERGTVMSEAGLTVRMETDCSSSWTMPDDSSADQRNCRRDAQRTVPKLQGNSQNVTLLPSFFVAPICAGIPGSPPYTVVPLKREVPKPAAVTPKKENAEIYATIETPTCKPEEAPTLPLRPTGVTQKPRNPTKSPRTRRPSTEPPPEPRTPRPSTEPSPRKGGVDNLVVEKAGGRGEVKEKLVYVVEEKGKSVTKVETDLFSLNEILTIKKDLLELSEFAKKLKQLKERNKPKESAKAGDGACRCEPTAKILKDVNKRIEALEMRQEELERGKKSIQKEELAEKKAKTPSSILHEPAKTTVNMVLSKQPKVFATGVRREPHVLSNATDLVTELLDIKEQLKRLEEKRSPKPVLEEMPVEKVQPKKKDGPIAVFSSKTYIFSPDKLESKEKENRGTENKALGDKVGFEEARIINWLKGVCSGGSDIKLLLKPSPTIMEESLAEGKVELACKNCCGPLEEVGNSGNQEPQKNRATQKDSRQDDFLKNGASSGKILNKRSYKECFVSPSGKFFAWMKRSSDKVMKNFCSDWPQTKVLRKVQPKQISRTTSTGSIVSMTRDFPPRGVRCPVLSDVSLSGNIQDFVRVFCKSEKTALNENMKCLGKPERRSLSKDKLQKEDNNEAVRRREPRRPRPKDSELSTSSSFSEIMDSMDFEITSNSVEGSRWQTSNQFHAQVFSCVAQPEYLMDTSHRRNEWVRETDRQRRKREKRERKAARRLQKRATKLRNKCEKRREKLDRIQEKYDSRCVLGGCDFGKDYWRKHPPVRQPQPTAEAKRQMPGEPYRPNIYKGREYPPVKQPYVSPRYSRQKYFEDKMLHRERNAEDYSCETGSSVESLPDPGKRQPERMKSVLSAERPSFERNTLREFFKSFGWLYPRLGEICGEFQERKKIEEEEEREVKDVRRARERRREKDEFPEDRFLKAEDYNRGSRREKNEFPEDRFLKAEDYSRTSISSARFPPGNIPHHHDPDRVEKCDCVRLYLQTQVEKKLEALKNIHISSSESLATDTSKSDFEHPKRQRHPPKSGNPNRKEFSRLEECFPKAEHYKNKDLDHRKYPEGVPKPEHERTAQHDPRYEGYDTRAHQQRHPVPEHHNKMFQAARREETKDHPARSNRKMRQRDDDGFCQYCGTAPCLIAEKHDIGKCDDSSGSTQQEELPSPPRREDHPRKEQFKPYGSPRQTHEYFPILSYLCQLWKNKNRHADASPPPERRVYSPEGQNSNDLIMGPLENERYRGKEKPAYSRRDPMQRNLDGKPWCLEIRRSPPEIDNFRQEHPEIRKVGGRASPRMADHPPTHAHCFLINDNCDNILTKTDLVCFPEDTLPERTCRQRRIQEEEREEEHQHRDQAIECHFLRDSQDMTDKTTETEDLGSTSHEKVTKRNLKARLVSLHCLWKNLRRCTMQKATFGREVRRSIRRSLSGLDTYDCWWSDAWPRPRRHRHCRRRCKR